MKLASYNYDGQKSYGTYTAGGIIDLGKKIGSSYPSLKSLLEGDALYLAGEFIHCEPDISLDGHTYLSVIQQPGKFLGVGMNYAAKRKEFDEQDPAPTLFIRLADSQTGHAMDIVKSLLNQEVDYEGELAVIIGKAAENIGREHLRNSIIEASARCNNSA